MLGRNREGCLGVSFHQICNKSSMGRFKAVRGRWIGPKIWDRIVGKFLRNFGLAVTVQNFSGLFVWQFCIKIMP